MYRMGGYIRPVAEQRLRKHVPTATVTHARGKWGAVYVATPRSYKEENRGKLVI
jgi:hypothetical protein